MSYFNVSASSGSNGRSDRSIRPLQSSRSPLSHPTDYELPYIPPSLAGQTFLHMVAKNVAKQKPVCTGGMEMGYDSSSAYFRGLMPYAVTTKDIRETIASGPQAGFWGITSDIT